MSVPTVPLKITKERGDWREPAIIAELLADGTLLIANGYVMFRTPMRSYPPMAELQAVGSVRDNRFNQSMSAGGLGRLLATFDDNAEPALLTTETYERTDSPTIYRMLLRERDGRAIFIDTKWLKPIPDKLLSKSAVHMSNGALLLSRDGVTYAVVMAVVSGAEQPAVRYYPSSLFEQWKVDLAEARSEVFHIGGKREPAVQIWRITTQLGDAIEHRTELPSWKLNRQDKDEHPHRAAREVLTSWLETKTDVPLYVHGG